MGGVDIADARECFDLGLGEGFGGQLVGEDVLFAGGCPVALGGLGDLIEAIGDPGRERDSPVGRDRPRRRGPDHHRGIQIVEGARLDVTAARADGELHPDGVALVIGVFDLGFGQGGALDDRPHDGLGTAIELA